MKARVQLAETPEEVERCFSVIHELRPHLELEAFVTQVSRQKKEGYQLAYLEDGGEVRACAGFRILEYLWCSRTMYVDDLITTSSGRSQGYGHELFEWLKMRALNAGCLELHLDSGVQRFDAHRFYLRERMHIVAHHFALKL